MSAEDPFQTHPKIKALMELTSKEPKTVKDLHTIIRAQSMLMADLVLEVSKIKAGLRSDWTSRFFDRVLAPLLVGFALWLLVDFGPALIKTIP